MLAISSLHRVVRQLSTGVSGFRCAELRQRGLISLKGPDALKLLQGCVTNDTNKLSSGQSALYAAALNEQGRVVNDLIIYRIDDGGDKTTAELLLECHQSSVGELIRWLIKYRLRKKVDIVEEAKRKIFALFNPDIVSVPPVGVKHQSDPQSLTTTPDISQLNCLSFVDPRVSQLGWRLIVDKTEAAQMDLLASADLSRGYDHLRYKLGVPEGPLDLLPGKGLPLESDLADLNGISFDKGCYIGQELTARTYHTGVVRKRLLPLVFRHENICALVQHGAKVTTVNGSAVGQFRNCPMGGTVGMALLRVKEAMETDELRVETADGPTIPCRTYTPFWWGRHEEKRNS